MIQNISIFIFVFYSICFFAYIVAKLSGIRFGATNPKSVFSRGMFMRAQGAFYPGLIALSSFENGSSGAPLLLAIPCLICAVFFTSSFFLRQMALFEDRKSGFLRALWLFPTHVMAGLLLFPFVLGEWFLILLSWFSPSEAEEQRMAEEQQQNETPRRLLP